MSETQHRHDLIEMLNRRDARVAKLERQLAEALTLLHAAVAQLSEDAPCWSTIQNAAGQTCADRYIALIVQGQGIAGE